jgi:hypothetical protein
MSIKNYVVSHDARLGETPTHEYFWSLAKAKKAFIGHATRMNLSYDSHVGLDRITSETKDGWAGVVIAAKYRKSRSVELQPEYFGITIA